MSDDPYRGGGLNPFNFPHRLGQYSQKSPDGDDARDVQDPHTWDDPEQSWRERVVPETVAGKIGAIVALFLGGGFLLYLLPIFAPTFRNPLFLGTVIILVILALYGLFMRHSGFKAAVRMSKSVILYGDDADIRFVEEQGTTGRSHLVTPIRSLSFAGLRPKPLRKRQLPFDANRLRSNLAREDEAGKEPVVDRLRGPETVRKDTETYGTIYITHASGMDFDEFARESDRVTTRPDTIDEEVAREMNDLIESLEASITTLRHQVEMLEERTTEVRDTRRGAIVDELQGSLKLMEQMTELAAKQTDGRKQNGSRRGSRSATTTDPVARLEKEIEEEMEEQR